MSTRSVRRAASAAIAGGIAKAAAASRQGAAAETVARRIWIPRKGTAYIIRPAARKWKQAAPAARSAIGHVVVVGVAGLVAVGLLALDLPADAVVALVDALVGAGDVAVAAILL